MSGYQISVVKLSLVRDSESVLGFVNNPCDVASIAQRYIGQEDREHFIVLLLSTKHAVEGIHTVSIGTLNSAQVHPREVFKAAILGNAAAIILAHNHPSGNPRPSDDDINITKRLVDAGNLLGINVLDHIIVGGNNFSFKEHGLL